MPVKCACAPAECGEAGGGSNEAPPPHEGATVMVPVPEAAAVLAKNEYISNPVAVAVAPVAAVKPLPPPTPPPPTTLMVLLFETPPMVVLRSVDREEKRFVKKL